MTAPYDYSAYSAMDPHVLQMADLGSGYWGAGTNSYTPLGGLQSYPPLSTGPDGDYATAPTAYPVPPVSVTPSTTTSAEVLEIGKSSVTQYASVPAIPASTGDALSAMYPPAGVWSGYPGYMPPDDKTSAPGGSSGYPGIPLPYSFPDGSDLNHAPFYHPSTQPHPLGVSQACLCRTKFAITII
uniref:YTH domain-containing protein n=1 Tax=Heterorhabditis bacteriophora TaxID=37862 RepID=A0A1I7WK35_HETBA